MAYTATVHDIHTKTPFFSRVWTGFTKFAVRYAESRSRFAEIEALSALTDEQLAKRGLTRDGIVRHVFSDIYYL